MIDLRHKDIIELQWVLGIIEDVSLTDDSAELTTIDEVLNKEADHEGVH
jgi:hypothetical protein